MKVLTEEQYLAAHGASADWGDAGLHIAPGVPESRKRRHVAAQARKDGELAARRAELRERYAAELEAGTVRPPTRREELLETAKGHPDNDATQAARRLLKKLCNRRRAQKKS